MHGKNNPVFVSYIKKINLLQNAINVACRVYSPSNSPQEPLMSRCTRPCISYGSLHR